MSNSGVNILSKQARVQDMGPILSNRGDLQGWPIINIFFLSLIFMVEIYVQFCGQRFLETGEVSGPETNSIESRDLWVWPITWDFLSIVNFHVGNLLPILWATFSRNRRGFRTWNHFHQIQGTRKGGQSHRIFFLSLIFKLEIYIQFCGQRFLETCEVSGPGNNSIECRGPERVDNHKSFSSFR